MKDFGKVYKYKNHFITITKKKENYFTANYAIDGKEYYSGNSDIGKILKYFRFNVDKLAEKNMKELTYKEVYKEWGNSSYKRVNYRDKVGGIRIRKRDKDEKVIYFVELDWYRKGYDIPRRTSFESIHYDKVVSRFQRFVDEYCTDWGYSGVSHPNPVDYKGYRIVIQKEKDKEFYLGTVQFHKNSTFKHIADTREEVERCCKNRIAKVVYEKEKVTKELLDSYKDYELEITYEPTVKYPYIGKEYVGRVSGLRLSWRGKTPEEVKKQFRDYFDEKGRGRVVKEEIKQINIMTPKQEKIQELEQLQARISAQLEELKKEKDTLTYKGVVLEYGREEWTQEGYLIGRIKEAPDGVDYFYGTSAETIKDKFEEYIDDLEKSAHIYNQLMSRQ